MGSQFTLQERLALYGMLAENARDIIVKSDARGFIVAASQALQGLGVNLPGLLFGPHIRDLVDPCHSAVLEAQHEAALAGRGDGGWYEYPAFDGTGDSAWFEIRMEGLRDAAGRPYGVLSVMHSVTERKALEERLFTAELTDPLTRLTNRKAFTSMLAYLVENGASGCLALFDLDHFMTINMRHGQAAGDDLLCAFADLLRSMVRREDIISRIDGERFAVLLPGADWHAAAAVCQPVIETLAALSPTTEEGYGLVSASAGLTRIARTLDHTLRQAEMALFLAKAKGRSRLELADAPEPAERAKAANLLAFPAGMA